MFMADLSRQRSLQQNNDDSRLIPLSIAGVVCFIVAVILGYGGWYFFGSHTRQQKQEAQKVTHSAPVTSSAPQKSKASEPKQETQPEIFAPQGTVPVTGGQVILGGENSEQPVQRLVIEPFAIAETEVTNAQYAEFIKATKHRTPSHWKNEFAEGEGDFPVTNVSWNDAKDFCKWLSEKLGAAVRLPSEAEWELAARGKEGLPYPWGKDWNDEAAVSKETNGKTQKVKSFSLNKSPFGAYDMAGNVWEWIEENARDADGKTKVVDGEARRIIKGGAADEPAKFVSATSRMEVPAGISDRAIGFRYVVVRENKKEETKSQASQEQSENKDVEDKK